jgi:hypothetical protein
LLITHEKPKTPKKELFLGLISYNFCNINNPRARNTWNSHFDAQLIMACEYQNNFDMETDTIFVTMEKSKIIQTFEKNGKSKFVMHLEEFKEKFNV